MAEQKATTQDAQLILELFNLRRESELRKARRWVESEFWPTSAEEYIKIASAFGTEQNTYIRMVGGYWEMACSFVIQGALNPALFHENNHEMYFLFAKVYPFLTAIRNHFEMPEMFSRMERVIETMPGGKERLTAFRARIERFQAEREKAAKQSTAAD